MSKNVGRLRSTLLDDCARTTVTADTPVNKTSIGGRRGTGDAVGVSDGVPLIVAVVDRVSPSASGVMDREGVGLILPVNEADADPLGVGDPVLVPLRVDVPLRLGVRDPDRLPVIEAVCEDVGVNEALTLREDVAEVDGMSGGAEAVSEAVALPVDVMLTVGTEEPEVDGEPVALELAVWL